MNPHDELMTEAKKELAIQEEDLARYRKVRERLSIRGNHPLYAIDEVISGTEGSITTIYDYIDLISEE